jgi:hypothetical protein
MGYAGKDGGRRAKAARRVIRKAKLWIEAHPHARPALLALYYLAIIAVLVAMYGRGNFETPEFVYAEF